MTTLLAFLLGALSMGSLTAGLFFFRFWRTARDRLFLFFALAFSILAADWMALAFVPPQAGIRHYIFVVRLVAFGLIIVGIIDKNGKRPPA